MKIKLFAAGTLLVAVAMVSCKSHYKLTSVERTRIVIDSRYDQHPDETAASFIVPFKRVNDSIMGPASSQCSAFITWAAYGPT